MTKLVNQLAVGDTVAAISNSDGTLTEFYSPLTVSHVQSYQGVPCIVTLQGAHMDAGMAAGWPTSKGDKRTCVLV